jgi:hypothetical protein
MDRNPAASFLQSAEQARTLLQATGFTLLVWEELAIASGAQRPPVVQRQSHIFPGVVAGPEVEEAEANMSRNVAEDRIRLIHAVFERLG